MAIGRIPEPGTGIPESIIAAKGDILTGTANDTPAVLTAGTNETRLVADSGEATGLKYVADTTNYAVAAKGDLLVGTAADTLAPLTVGADGTTLVADSAEATGLKWQTPASGGGMTLLETLSFSGSSVTSSSIAGTYKNLEIIVRNFLPASSNRINMRINGDTGTNYTIVTGNNEDNVATTQTFAIMGDGQYNSSSNSLMQVFIPDYANATTVKMLLSYSITNNGITPANFQMNRYANVYDQTGAITTLTFFPNAGNFTSGEALIYGVK